MRISDWSSDVCSSDLASMAYALYFGTVAGLVRVMVAGYVYMCAEAKRCEWLTEDSMVQKDCGKVMTMTFLVLLLDGTFQALNFGAVYGAADMIDRKSTRLNSSH